jgi:hypothetical protein
MPAIAQTNFQRTTFAETTNLPILQLSSRTFLFIISTATDSLASAVANDGTVMTYPLPSLKGFFKNVSDHFLHFSVTDSARNGSNPLETLNFFDEPRSRSLPPPRNFAIFTPSPVSPNLGFRLRSSPKPFEMRVLR